MFIRLGNWISRHWLAVILIWIAAVVGLRLAAPRWDDVTRDGDLAYLPSDMPSAVGEQLLASAFPDHRAKSQIALYIAREQQPLISEDYSAALDVARRFRNSLAARLIHEGDRLQNEGSKLGASYWSQLGRIVYGASDEKRGFMTVSRNLVHPRTEIRSGLLSEDSEDLLKRFFNKLRN